MRAVKCPKCGNDEHFTLVLNYVNLDVKSGMGGYVAAFDGGELSHAICEKCFGQLSDQEAKELYERVKVS